MNQILIIAGVIGLLLFLRWIRKQPRNKQIQGTLIFAAILLIGLALAGRLHWLFAIGAAAAATFQKLLGLLRYAPMFKNLFSNTSANDPEDRQYEHRTNHPVDINMDDDEAYKILGIDSNASKEEIIQAHRKLIQKIHPDRGGNDYLATKINQAKDHLLSKFS